MVDFSLTDEQRLLEQSVREWGAREVAPYIRENDRNHHFDRERIVGGMAKLGLLGISVPQQYGGAGMDYICLGVASEELEYLDTSLRVIMSVHAGLNCLSLLTWGTEDQKQRYLVPQAQGTKLSGYGLTEPGAGSDARAIQTTAVKKGSGYVLNGEKSWISLADVADNFLVIAWTDQEKKKQRDPSGLSAFMVERTFKGFSSGPMKEKWGILAGNTGWFKMDDVEVPEENMVGRPGEGFKIAMFALDQGRYTVAAGATGLIRACRDASVKYAKEREAFGRPIAAYQGISFKIARMEARAHTARLAYYRAAALMIAGREFKKEAAIAKLIAGEAAMDNSRDATQVFGGYGFMNEFVVARHYRDSKILEVGEGTTEVQLMLVARELGL